MEPALPPMPPDSPVAHRHGGGGGGGRNPQLHPAVPAGAAHLMHFPMPAQFYDAQQGFMGMLPPLDINGDGESADDHRPRGRAGGGGGGGRGGGRARGRRRRRRREDTSDEDEDEETSEERPAEPPEYHPEGAEDYNIFFAELGEPTPQHRCFGCRYAGQAKSGKFSDVAIKEIFSVMADGIGVTWPPALAVELGKLQEVYRTKVNKTLKPGETKVPKWKPATVLIHWILHTCDPEIRQWLQLMRIQAQMYHIERNALNVRSRITGRTMPHKDNTMVWSRLLHDWWFLSAKDPRKFSYFNEGVMFDRKSVTTPGGFVTKGRPMYNFYGSPGENKRRRTIEQID